jgi:hypothetical protein
LITLKPIRAALGLATAIVFFLGLPGTAAADLLVLSPTADSYTNSAKATANFGREKTLFIRYDPDNNARNFIFMRFDASSIPRGSSISEATLKIYLNEMTGQKTVSLGVYRATSDWSETNIHSQNKPTGPGPITRSTIVDGVGYKSFDITEIFTGWLGGTFPNYGVFLGYQGNKGFTADFNSRDALGSQPQLLIYYAPPSAGTSVISGMPMASGREPLISDAKASNIKNGSATITWKTDGMTTSKVRYGLSAAYADTSTSSNETTAHSIVITGLESDKIYHFRVYGRNKAGLEAMSADFKFRTPKAIAVETAENNNRWGWVKLVAMGIGLLLLFGLGVIMVFEFPRWRRGEFKVRDVLKTLPALLREKIQNWQSKRK